MMRYQYISNPQEVELLHQVIYKTKSSEISWVELLEIQRYLEKDNISISRIRWLHKYLRHLQLERFIALPSSTYITIFEGKLLLLARSKYSGNIRLDWMEIKSHLMTWHRWNVSNIVLMRLQQSIESTGISSLRSDVEEILYSTEHICV